MLYNYLRVIDSDNAVLSDSSLINQDVTKTLPMGLVVGEDFIYLGQYHPFNNFFMKAQTVNDVTATMKIEYWGDSAWNEAVDVLDGTAVSGIPIAQSGVVQFTPNIDKGWSRVDDTTESDSPTELADVTIYDLYWIRISYNDSLNASTALERITYAFTRSQQISDLDVKIDNYLESFATGKTNWDDEIITASVQVVRDLKRKGLIKAVGQIILFDDVSVPTDWKTLEIIYRNLGEDYLDRLSEAKKQYGKEIAAGRYSFDQNKDARVSTGEKNFKACRLIR